jgi:uncharacterized protein with HEPN domain
MTAGVSVTWSKRRSARWTSRRNAAGPISTTTPCCDLALSRAVEIVGEAANQVSESGRSELPGVPWPQIVGMRNRLVHAYFDIDRDILWDTVQIALPVLLAQLRPAAGGN